MINADKWQEHDLVFPNLVGNPIDPNNMIKDFRKLTEKAGLTKIRFHDIRHTCATLLLLAIVHPKIVSERLGNGTRTKNHTGNTSFLVNSGISSIVRCL